MAKQQLHDGNDEGATIGAASTDLAGFHGLAADQYATISLATGATIATVVTAVQSILAMLEEKGMIASDT